MESWEFDFFSHIFLPFCKLSVWMHVVYNARETSDIQKRAKIFVTKQFYGADFFQKRFLKAKLTLCPLPSHFCKSECTEISWPPFFWPPGPSSAWTPSSWSRVRTLPCGRSSGNNGLESLRPRSNLRAPWNNNDNDKLSTLNRSRTLSFRKQGEKCCSRWWKASLNFEALILSDFCSRHHLS